VGDHAFADATAGEAVGFGAAENAENIVLCAGEAVGLEELLGFLAEEVRDFLESDEDAVLEGERRVGSGAAAHGQRIVVMTTTVKRKKLQRERSVGRGTVGWP
jgi:hypothetical protein